MGILQYQYSGTILAGILIVVILAILIIKAKNQPKSEEYENGKDYYPTKVLETNENSKPETLGETQGSDLELVAAIMAALCVYTGKAESELNIKSIKRVDGNQSSWRREAVLNRLR